MPAPAIYVFAIIGTVGAVIAFKEFVYDPHIAPAIDRWKIEFQASQAARRRRAAAALNSEVEVPMYETIPRDSLSDSKLLDEDASTPSTSGDPGKGSHAPNNMFMKDGLLMRRTELDIQVPPKSKDLELDILSARELSERRSEVTGSALRQRKNASENSLNRMAYTPLSPSRTHVLFSPSSPLSAGTTVDSSLHASRSPQLHPTGMTNTGDPLSSQAGSETNINPSGSALPVVSISPPPVVASALSPRPQGNEWSTQNVVPTPGFDGFASLLPVVSLPLIPQRISPSPGSPTSNPLTTAIDPISPHLPFVVPSLSQSYPQVLDYENGLELLSPPSSRSTSPFSMADMSPNLISQSIRPLSPFGSRSASGFSSAVASPSPLRMGLGNESFATLSPAAQFGNLLSPFLDPPAQQFTTDGISASATSSAKSTTYLSFDEESSDAGDDSQPQSSFPQPIPRRDMTNTMLGSSSQTPVASTFHRPSGIEAASSSGESPSLGLTLFPPQPPPSSSVQPMDATIRLAADSSSFVHRPPSRARANATGHASPAPQSDAELSDLDLISDYGLSESDLGNESDSSWSLAGGSSASSPRVASTAIASNVQRGDVFEGHSVWR